MKAGHIHPPLQRVAATLDSLCLVLAKDRPLKVLLFLSFIAATAYCLSIFDTGFLLGTSQFWNNPRGIVPNGWADPSTALSGYLYFQRDTWQLPLFHVEKLGFPRGTNIIFTDSIPLVALVGRLVFRATGAAVNLYGLWTASCFAASAMTMTVLAATLGQRNLAAAAMATMAGLCMPALLARWGHMSLMAQFEIPLALIFYLRHRRGGSSWRLFIQAVLLMWLALWTHTYLFVMIGAIVLVTVAQAVSNRALSASSAGSVVAGLVFSSGILIAISGHLQTRGGLGAEGVGVYSMNLLSPFVPQLSGIFLALRNTIADGTGGQYEGFSYLGVGILLLLLMTLPWQIRMLQQEWRGHVWLIGASTCFTLFALSNVIYLGGFPLLHIPLPEGVEQFAATLRATGRFFWPVMYMLAALAVVAPVSFYGPRGVLLLCLALPLQWIDAAPLRHAVVTSIKAPEKSHIDLIAWKAAIQDHRSVQVLPQNFCLARGRGWNSEVAVQMQLLAAFTARPINSVYAARQNIDCDADQRIEGSPQPGARQLSIFLDEFSGFSRMQKLASSEAMCRAGPGLVVCSDVETGPVLAKLAWTDHK